MIELSLRPNLAHEVGDRIGRRLMKREHLNGALAAHDAVDRLENLPHAALPARIGHDVGTQLELRPTGFDLIGLIGRKNAHLDEPSR